jgi:hypothetical protein
MSPSILFTSNPAEYTALERVYVTELAGPGFVQGISRNTVAIAGACVRGPVDTPVVITSKARFLEVFGGRDKTADGTGGTYLGEIHKALLGKPFGRLVCVRACAAAAVAASFTLETAANGSGTAVLKVDASSPGTWGNDVKVKVEAATDGDATHFNLRVSYLGQTKLYENLDITTGQDNTLNVIGDDEANWIVLTKLASGTPLTAAMSGLDSDGYINLGETVASFTSVAGTDGTIADTDYTATGRAIDQIAAYPGVALALVAERAGSTINGAIITAAATATDRMFAIWSGNHADEATDVISDVAGLTASDRVVYCFNSPYMLDPQTGAQIQVPPHHAMASCFSQTAVNQHVGSNRTKAYNAGIKGLTYETLTGDDYKDLRAAGICALERTAGGNPGFVFVSGVTTDLTSQRSQIARRREVDYLQLSMSEALQDFVKEENTEDVQAEIGGEVVAFLSGFKRAKQIVKDFSVEQGPEVNTEEARAQGVEVIQTNVKLYGHILGLVLRTNMGTGVTVATDAAA